MTLSKKKDESIVVNKVLISKDNEKEHSADLIDRNINISNEEYIGQLVAIVESSKDAIISKSIDGTIKSWNNGSERMFGYSSKEVIGKSISLIIPPECVNEEKEIIARICNNEVIDNYETVRIKKNRERFYVSLTVSPMKDRVGNIIGISKIARDITARKKAELDHIKDNKELIFQNEEKGKRAEELIIANKELAFQNQEKEKRAEELKIANKELIFQNKEKEKRAGELSIANIELVFQNEEKEKRAEELIIANKELAFQNEEKEKRAGELIIANKELAFQNKEKEKRTVEFKIANIELVFQNEEKEKRAAELSIANVELAFQNIEKEKRAAELSIANKELAFQNKEKEKRAAELDIANKELAFQNQEKEKREAELNIANVELAFQNGEKEKRAAELIVANKELEAFSYSVSHDLRAPLRALHGYARMLKETQMDLVSSETNRLTNNIIGNAKKMGQLIDDLLTFSRLGRKELIKISIPMNDLVTSICDELKKEQEPRDIEFRIKSLLPARADNIAIKQVWLNLISNAIKYSKLKDKTVIEIDSQIKDEEIIYSIKDNGAGFDMRYVNKLFGVFQRLHSDEEFEGTGVGLAIVQRIILKHGGRVWAEGIINKGATFFFTLIKS